MRLKRKTALITGGAQGIGRAIAEAYVEQGAEVVIADINAEAAKQTANEIGSQAVSVSLDVTRQTSIDSVIETLESHNGLDILVNNAAIFDLAPIADITEQSYEQIFNVNVKGTLFMLKAAATLMRKQNEITPNRGGKIINMASQAGRRGEALVGVYCASKAAVISLTQSAGRDLIQYGINVNAISPGVVDTPMWDTVDALFAKYEKRPIGEKKKIVGEEVPFGRMGVPDDHVGAAIFLGCDDSSYIVGQTINVDGGNWMS